MPTRIEASYDGVMERPLIVTETARWWPSTLWQTTTLEVERDGVRLLVDPGVSPWEVREVAAGRPVHHILITHADWDHVMGIGLLPEATVHAGGLATRRIRSGEATESVCQESREFCIPLEGLDGMRVDEVIEPPAEVMIGPWAATVQAIPGHTDDGIATLLPEEGLLIVGDYLSVLEIPFIYESPRAYRDTLDRLVETIERDTPAHIVIGHGAPHDAVLGAAGSRAGPRLRRGADRLRRRRRRSRAPRRRRLPGTRRRRRCQGARIQRAGGLRDGGGEVTAAAVDLERLRSLAEDAAAHLTGQRAQHAATSPTASRRGRPRGRPAHERRLPAAPGRGSGARRRWPTFATSSAATGAPPRPGR